MSIYFKFTKNCIKPEFVTKKDNTVNNIKNNSKLQVLSQLSMEYIQLGIDTLTRMTKHEFKKRATRGRKRKNPLPQTPLEEDENKFNKDQTEISVEKLSINKKFLIVDRLSLLPYDFKIYLLLACLNYLALDDSNENNSCTNNGKEQPSDDVLKTKSIISKIVVMFEVSFGNLDALIKGLTSATRKLLEWRSNNVVDVMKELEDIHTSFTCNSIVGSGSNYCNNNQDGFLLSMGLDDSHSSSGAAGSSTDDTDLNCFTELSSPSSNNISPHMVDLSFQPSSKRQRSVSCVTPTPVSAVSSSASSVGTNCSKTTETTSGNSLFSSIQANRMSRASSCASNSSNSTSTYNNSMMMSRGSSINRRSSSISTTATSTSMAMKRGNSSMSNSNPPSSLIPNSLPASYRTGSLFANHKPNPNMNRNSQSQFNGYDNCYYPKNGSSISGSVDTDHINTFLDTFTHNDGNHNQKTNYNIRRKGDTHEVSSLTANTASDIYDVDMDIMDLEVSNLTTTNVENNASANKDFNYFNEFFKWNGTTSNGATTPNGKLGSGTNIANIADMCAFQTSLDPLAPASNGQKLNGASSLQKDNDDLMRLKEKVLSLKSSRGDSEWD
ncbi:hypothetical protein PACTADRAFT_48686 [Pachysolen tannophilus NRRL Y-2460]|uniref:Uncharacterized protein n=1 Tax=Pachysolen tannophilus NRRL Y-2460 TaxID=669874 RepID=A0A1E4TYQ9_PACTA|nr:hypothetical protein PACTADRAFT_48686 [Pachysolen tannophilus NRRL Y-2460]